MEVQSVEMLERLAKSPDVLERLAILVAERLAEQMPQQLLFRIPDAARMIGRGFSSVYEMLGDGRLKGVKSDGRTLVTGESLRRYAASLPAAKIEPSKRAMRRKARRKAAA
jgi:hypothetical protein